MAYFLLHHVLCVRVVDPRPDADLDLAFWSFCWPPKLSEGLVYNESRPDERMNSYVDWNIWRAKPTRGPPIDALSLLSQPPNFTLAFADPRLLQHWPTALLARGMALSGSPQSRRSSWSQRGPDCHISWIWGLTRTGQMTKATSFWPLASRDICAGYLSRGRFVDAQKLPQIPRDRCAVLKSHYSGWALSSYRLA